MNVKLSLELIAFEEREWAISLVKIVIKCCNYVKKNKNLSYPVKCTPVFYVKFQFHKL